MKPRTRVARKLLIASVGIAAVSYACEKKPEPVGNLVAPQPTPTMEPVGNLVAPEPMPSAEPQAADASSDFAKPPPGQK